VERETTSWGQLVGGQSGRLGLRRLGSGEEPAAPSVVRPRTLLALLVLALLFLAASWVDAGTAAPTASPDPHPSAEKSEAPVPDAYQPPASVPSTPEPVTEPVIEVETTPSAGTVTRTSAQPTTDTSAGARAQKQPAKEPEKAAAASKPRRERVRIAVPTPGDDGSALLLGGIAMVVLALASGSLLFLVTRAGSAGVGRWEVKS